MRWLVRAGVPILVLVLLAGSANVSYAKSTDYVNDQASCPPEPAGDCDDRSADPAAMTDVIACPVSAACAAPYNQPQIGYSSELQTGVTLKHSGGLIFPFTPLGTACGRINQCDCDSAGLLAARLFNSYKRKHVEGAVACGGAPNPAGFAVKQSFGFKADGVTPADYENCNAGNLDDTEACQDVFPGERASLEIRTTAGGPKCSLFVFKAAGGIKLDYEADPSCAVEFTYVISNGGNTVKVDLLTDYIVQIKRNGINGVVQFDVLLTPTSTPVVTTVTTLPGDSNDVVADKVVTAFNTTFGGAPYFFNAVKFANATAAGSRLEANSPGTFEAGQPVVRIVNVKHKVAVIGARGVAGALQGQEIISENVDQNVAVPTLSEWAMIIVALLLLGSGYWLFRRQQRPAMA